MGYDNRSSSIAGDKLESTSNLSNEIGEILASLWSMKQSTGPLGNELPTLPYMIEMGTELPKSTNARNG
jgi:hypothetical protein